MLIDGHRFPTPIGHLLIQQVFCCEVQALVWISEVSQQGKDHSRDAIVNGSHGSCITDPTGRLKAIL